MTSHLNSHRTTDIEPEMLSGVQTGNGTPHDKYSVRGITHAQTNRKDDNSYKDDQCKTLHLYWSGVKGLVHWRSTHGTGHIPLCGIFSVHAAYSALRHFFIRHKMANCIPKGFLSCNSGISKTHPFLQQYPKINSSGLEIMNESKFCFAFTQTTSIFCHKKILLVTNKYDSWTGDAKLCLEREKGIS